MKVLIADDDFISRKVLEKTLKKWDYDVVVAEDGLQAWEILKANDSPSMAILDWMMPGLNGVELVKKIRLAGLNNYVFSILLTSKTDKADVICGIYAGADDYLTKPFNQDELRARLRTGKRIIELEQKLARQNSQLLEVNDNLVSANNKMKMDLQAAANIQKTLLPNKVPDIPKVNIEWLYKPCDELAGDILNVFLLDENHLGLYLLDVSGHGVSAALLSVTLSRMLSPQKDESSLLRTWVNGTDKFTITPPAEVAHKLNKQFAMDDESGQYFTLVYGILDLEIYEYNFIAAGHPNSVLMQGGKTPVTFDNAGLPIGFFDGVVYQEQSVRLHPGDRIFIYSDGINEAMNNSQEQFGSSRLFEHLRKNHLQPLDISLTETVAKVEQWSNNKLDDDISLLSFELVNRQ